MLERRLPYMYSLGTRYRRQSPTAMCTEQRGGSGKVHRGGAALKLKLSLVVMLCAIISLVHIRGVVGHSSLVSPFARNSVDRDLPQWKGGHFGNGTHCAHPAPKTEWAKDGICWGCNW